jgi:polysaccharide pyruvyl transferase WcaK-like protein
VICTNCGLVYVNPRQSQSDVGERYLSGDFTAEARGSDEPSWGKVFESEKRALERYRILRQHVDLHALSSNRSLEVGSGVGSFSRLLHGHGFDAEAVEPDPSYSSFGSDLYDIPIHDDLYQDISYPSSAFGLVASFHVLEHLPSPRSVLEKAHAETCTDGYIFLEVPTIDQPYRGDLEDFFWSAHLFTFSKKTLAGLLRTVGFEPVASGIRDTAFLWMIARKPESASSVPPLPFDDPETVFNRTHSLYRQHVASQPASPGLFRQLRGLAASATRRVRLAPYETALKVGTKLEAKGRRLQDAEDWTRPVGQGLQTVGRSLARTSMDPAKDYVAHYGLHTPGNAGDTALFAAVRDALDGVSADRETTNWSLEPLWDSITPLTVERLNKEARAVVIGGGGLFLPDTNTNSASGWQWACPTELISRFEIPLIVYAVGYNQFRGQEGFPDVFDRNVQALVENAAFVGLRNHGSIRRLSDHLSSDLADRLVYQPCPTTVLSRLHPSLSTSRHRDAPVLALNTAFDRHWLRFQGHEREVLSAIAKALRHAQRQGWEIHFVQHVAPRDGSALPWLDGAGIDYREVVLHEEPVDAVLQYYRDVDLAVGMRGHSQMISFGLETPILSLISHDKLRWFLEDIGHPEWGVEILDDDLDFQLQDRIDAVADDLEGARDQVRASQDALWDRTRENRRRIRSLLGG